MVHQSYAFNRIHIFNFPLARALAFFCPVYFRTFQLPNRLSTPFRHLEFRDVDAWNSALIKAYAVASSNISERTVSGGMAVLLQYQIRKIEELVLFNELIVIEEAHTNSRIVNTCSAPVLGIFVRLFNLAWYAYLHFKAYTKQVIEIFLYWVSFDTEGVAFLFFGVSAAEIPKNNFSLDFGWWTKIQICSNKESLFVSSVSPDKEQTQYLKKDQTNVLVARQLLGGLTFDRKLLLTFTLLGLLLRDTIRGLVFMDLGIFESSRIHMERAVWRALLKVISPKVLISSLSASWPEHGMVLAAHDLGIRTVNWSYAASSFAWTRRVEPFNDKLLWRSVICADEVWVWNGPARRVLEQRAVSTSPRPSWFEMGPMMCGDPLLLDQSADHIRRIHWPKAIGKKVLSIYDMPVYRSSLRAREGFDWGPYTNLKSQGGLFSLGKKALEEFPDLFLLLKIKRADLRDFDVPTEYFELVDPNGKFMKSGRVKVFEFNSDPYLAIAMSDVVIAAPFTSPVLAAQEAGVAGFYFDYSGDAVHTFEEHFKPITEFNLDSALERIGKIISAEPTHRTGIGQRLVTRLRERFEALRA